MRIQSPSFILPGQRLASKKPPQPPEDQSPDQVTLTKGKALEYGGFAALMVGGSVVVANSVGVMSSGSGIGLTMAALGAVAMVGGKYVQNHE